MDYSEAGTFGYDADPAESSFRQACFAGSDRYESQIVRDSRALGGVRKTIQFTLPVDGQGVIDLSEFGISPSKYRFLESDGPLAGDMVVSYQDVSVRSVQDLGHGLTRLAKNGSTPADVRDSIHECMAQLCAEETVFTEDIYSARPEVTVSLRRGSASRLRPVDPEAKVQVIHTGTRSFTIRPFDRIDVGVKVRRSRDLMVAQRACGNTPPPPEGGCDPATSAGFEATYRGCTIRGRTLNCELTLTSLRKDREIDLFISSGNNKTTHVVDDQGSYHIASYGKIANLEDRRFISTQLIANQATPVKLEFTLNEDPENGLRSLSIFELPLGTRQGPVLLEFRDLPIDVRDCRGRRAE